MHLLLVEDEKKVALFLKSRFEESGDSVDLAFDGEEGVLKATSNVYDLIIMDVIMPKKDGWAATREIREKGITVPILYLTGRDSPDDIDNGFKAGCDDYLPKPFFFPVLKARCNALIRKRTQSCDAEIHYADLRLDPLSRKVWRSNKELELSAKEYVLLEYFMQNPNQVLSRSMIAERVFDYKVDVYTNIIDVYINYLCEKVDRDYDQKLIKMIRGVGYALKED
ncbi:response regulator transcription factor [Malonomonas rubra]|uniref:response regulator transcription factor n=1 Tax=Malonomonas rubra TaxID=57040 RepID=UPI0026E94431|nr:response regulator transcription factor [Malonomonas rubra]